MIVLLSRHMRDPDHNWPTFHKNWHPEGDVSSNLARRHQDIPIKALEPQTGEEPPEALDRFLALIVF